MENNDSPYIYEKPLRSELKQRSKRLAGLSALGLVGMVGIFGGSAIANTVVSSAAANSTGEAEAVEVVDPQSQTSSTSGDPLLTSAAIEPQVTDSTSVISVPLQETKPRPNSVKVELPELPTQNFGNTSSATPSIGSGNYSTGATGSGPVKFETRGERHERDESDDDNEYEND